MNTEKILKLIMSTKIVDRNNQSINSLTVEQRKTVGVEILAETESEVNKISAIIEEIIDERIALALSGKTAKKRGKKTDDVDLL